MKRTRGMQFHNSEPTEASPDTPEALVRVQFANKLQAAMTAKGMTQAELARAASLHLAGDEAFTRMSISQYVRAKVLPGPIRLKAIADALGRTPAELLPHRGVSRAENTAPAISVREAQDGLVWLQVNQAVPLAVAAKVMALLGGTD